MRCGRSAETSRVSGLEGGWFAAHSQCGHSYGVALTWVLGKVGVLWEQGPICTTHHLHPTDGPVLLGFGNTPSGFREGSLRPWLNLTEVDLAIFILYLLSQYPPPLTQW